jgi:hypothetical protein
VTAAQLDDAEGHALVEAIHEELAEKNASQRLDLETPGVRYAPTIVPTSTRPIHLPTDNTRTGTP